MLYAKLDETRMFVLCGVSRCGTQLAHIEDHGGDGAPARLLMIAPGWSDKGDGIIRMDRHAQKEFERIIRENDGLTPRPAPATHRDGVDWPRHLPKARRGFHDLGGMRRQLARRLLLPEPQQIKCPRRTCEQVQWLDASILDVLPDEEHVHYGPVFGRDPRNTDS